MPNTFVGSVRQVAEGTVGMLPFFIGISFMATVALYMDQRFQDVSHAGMAVLYNMNADSLFDTFYTAN
jgi:hypothetical protein